MSNYILKDTGKKEIIKCEIKEGYTFSSDGTKTTRYKSVTIYNKAEIEKILTKKLDSNIKKLLLFIENISDEPTGEGNKLAINEVLRIKTILDNKYQKFLTQEKYYKYLEKLEYIYDNLNIKTLYNEEEKRR